VDIVPGDGFICIRLGDDITRAIIDVVGYPAVANHLQPIAAAIVTVGNTVACADQLAPVVKRKGGNLALIEQPSLTRGAW
jgi:hypothetical protein